MRTPIVAVMLGAIFTVTGIGYARSADSGPALDDAAIVAIFDLANTADIETGRLGAERASDPEVRQYGQMLADVHTAVRQQGRDLAQKLGVTPALPADNTMARDHAAAVTRLKNLRGKEFDRAFVRHEEAFHAAVISALNTTLVPAIRNAELKKFVLTFGPAFESHRLRAEQLERKLAE